LPFFYCSPSGTERPRGWLSGSTSTPHPSNNSRSFLNIGEKRARAIVNYRHKHGPFHSLDQLVEVADIGGKSLEAIKPYLALETTPLQPNKPGATLLQPKITTLPGDIVVLQDAEYFSTLANHIKSAQYSICMTMFLFKTTSSPGNKAGLLVKELINARKKGVDVLVILENSGYGPVFKQRKSECRARAAQ
jgi:competence ComEA-like helix-hairpin-helix protein